jgi:ABC-type branched-subunit amino acid transport system substrate-binding protein
MSGRRVALLVGCSDYQDQKFHQLPAPVQDVDKLRRVLTDPTIGDFSVTGLCNEPAAEVRKQIEMLFADHKRDDLLLLHFSCHGVLDPRGQLYLVAADTEKERLDTTAISARWVRELMDHSRSQRIVLLLDCCYSGAFATGLRRGSAGTEEILEQLGGHGRAVITASDKTQYAYESEFTTYPSHGLYFRAAPPNTFEGSVLGKLVVADGNSTVVVMSRDDVYGDDLRKATENVIKNSGGHVLDSFSYDSSTPGYDKAIQRIKTENPDAIVLIGFAESGHFLSNMVKASLGPGKKQVYGSSGDLTNTLAGQVSPQNPAVLAGMKGTLPYPGDEAFVKRLKEANHGLRDLTYAAQAYDAVVITALAAAVAGTDAPAAVAKQINGVTRTGERCTSFAACMALVKDHKAIAYDGPSGPLRFTDHDEPSSATYNISEIQADGTLKTLRSETVTPATTPAPAQPSGR